MTPVYIIFIILLQKRTIFFKGGGTEAENVLYTFQEEKKSLQNPRICWSWNNQGLKKKEVKFNRPFKFLVDGN